MIRPTPSTLLKIGALGLALGWSVFLARLHLEARATVLDRLESSLVDLRFLAAGRRQAPPDVLIVAVDDAAGRWAKELPLPRNVLADLIKALFAKGAKVVALDFLFFDPSTPDKDAVLAGALRTGPTVVAAAIAFAREKPGPGGTAADCGLPLTAIRKATSVGVVNISLDQSGIPRHVPMLLACAGHLFPALPLRAASFAARSNPAFETDAVSVGASTTPLDAGNSLALRYYGPEGSIETVGAADILDDHVAPEQIRGRTILIGTTASGTGDRFPTPFDSVLPGVEVLATAVANLQTGEALVRTSLTRRVDAAVMIVLAFAVVLFLTMQTIEIGLTGLLVLLAALLIFTFVGFAYGYWFALAMPLAAMGPVAALAGGARLGLDRWTERKMLRQQRLLGTFQSPAIVSQLSADPNFLARPVEREIAAVFIDLTGFTGLTERLGPQKTRDFLKEFHAIVEEDVSNGGGIVASYMGDGAMLVWGMAGPTPRNALGAVRTALSLQARTLAWLDDARPRTGAAIGLKIGGHFGPVVLSRLGHATHQHVAATGDTVNVAARLMEVAAERGAVTALSTRLLDAAMAQGFSADAEKFSESADVAIRGRQHPVSVRFSS